MDPSKQEYSISELANAFPDMSSKEYEKLKASIREDGLLEPIAIWDGEVIDGRHRYKACLETDVEPRFEHLPDDVDPVRYVITKNDTYRHLDASRRAVIAYKLSRWSRPGGDRRSKEYRTGQDHYAKVHNGLDQSLASNLLGVSRRSTIDAGTVLSEAGPADPAVRSAVEQGLLKVSAAGRVINEPTELQREALERVLKGESRTIARAVDEVKAELWRREDELAAEAKAGGLCPETVTLHHCPVGELHNVVAAGSVHVIVTHPPGTAESLPLYSELVAFADHALREDEMMAVMGNANLLPQLVERLQHPGLKWVAEFDYHWDGSPSRSSYPHRITMRRRPLLVYGKRRFQLNGGDDVINVPSLDEVAIGQPRLHQHDVGMSLVVQRFARPGQVVSDPFLLGRCGTAHGARNHGCIFVGADKDRSCIDRTRSLLARLEGAGKS